MIFGSESDIFPVDTLEPSHHVFSVDAVMEPVLVLGRYGQLVRGRLFTRRSIRLYASELVNHHCCQCNLASAGLLLHPEKAVDNRVVPLSKSVVTASQKLESRSS
jgi:hypothetical protein